MLGIGLGLSREEGVTTYDPDAQAFFARAKVSDPAVKGRHDKMVLYAKSTELWSDLDLWYNAEGGVFKAIGPDTAAADSDPVRVWINARRASGDLEQTASLNQPVWMASGGPGGAAAVRGDGVNSFMTSATPSVSSPFTFLLFGKDIGTVGPTSWRMIMMGGGSGNPCALTAHHDERGLIRMTGGWSRMVALYNQSGNYVLAGVFNGTSNSAVYRTGAPLFSGAFVTPTVYGPLFSLFGHSSGNQMASGYVSQAMVFRQALTESQIKGWEDLLSNLYGGL